MAYNGRISVGRQVGAFLAAAAQTQKAPTPAEVRPFDPANFNVDRIKIQCVRITDFGNAIGATADVWFTSADGTPGKATWGDPLNHLDRHQLIPWARSLGLPLTEETPVGPANPVSGRSWRNLQWGVEPRLVFDLPEGFDPV